MRKLCCSIGLQSVAAFLIRGPAQVGITVVESEASRVFGLDLRCASLRVESKIGTGSHLVRLEIPDVIDTLPNIEHSSFIYATRRLPQSHSFAVASPLQFTRNSGQEEKNLRRLVIIDRETLKPLQGVMSEMAATTVHARSTTRLMKFHAVATQHTNSKWMCSSQRRVCTCIFQSENASLDRFHAASELALPSEGTKTAVCCRERERECSQWRKRAQVTVEGNGTTRKTKVGQVKKGPLSVKDFVIMRAKELVLLVSQLLSSR